jgi:hypothetical protein
MFTIHSELKNIHNYFLPSEEHVYCLLENGILLKYNISLKSIQWMSRVIDNASAITLFDGNIYCSKDFNSTIINSTNGDIFKECDYDIILILFGLGKCLAVKKEDEKRKLLLLNQAGNELWKTEIKIGKFITYNSEIIFNTSYLNDQIINGYNLTDFGSLWQFDVAAYAKFYDIYQESRQGLIAHIIGVHKNTFWFGLTSGKLLALDIRTGILKHEIGFNESDLPVFQFQIKQDDYIPYGEFMQLNTKRDKIIGLRDKYFMYIDLKDQNPTRRYVEINRSMELHKISSIYSNYTFPSDENFIFFCDDRKGKIGVFDIVNLEVVWSYEIEMQKHGISQILDMKYVDNIWYVLDRNNTLHIFERN